MPILIIVTFWNGIAFPELDREICLIRGYQERWLVMNEDQDLVCDACGETLCHNCGNCHNIDCAKYSEPTVDCDVGQPEDVS
jgi:hypothetical protein